MIQVQYVSLTLNVSNRIVWEGLFSRVKTTHKSSVPVCNAYIYKMYEKDFLRTPCISRYYFLLKTQENKI